MASRFFIGGRLIKVGGRWSADSASDTAMRSDIEFLKECGFNMIRKHIKIEPRRYYYHCDQLGMIMWQDQVSNGYGKNGDQESTSPPWTRMAPNPRDASWPA